VQVIIAIFPKPAGLNIATCWKSHKKTDDECLFETLLNRTSLKHRSDVLLEMKTDIDFHVIISQSWKSSQKCCRTLLHNPLFLVE